MLGWFLNRTRNLIEPVKGISKIDNIIISFHFRLGSGFLMDYFHERIFTIRKAKKIFKKTVMGLISFCGGKLRVTEPLSRPLRMLFCGFP